MAAIIGLKLHCICVLGKLNWDCLPYDVMAAFVLHLGFIYLFITVYIYNIRGVCRLSLMPLLSVSGTVVCIVSACQSEALLNKLFLLCICIQALNLVYSGAYLAIQG